MYCFSFICLSIWSKVKEGRVLTGTYASICITEYAVCKGADKTVTGVADATKRSIICTCTGIEGPNNMCTLTITPVTNTCTGTLTAINCEKTV
jgi:hypothetical protein